MKKATLAFIFLLSTLSICLAQSSATYDISFTSTWNASDHGTLPSNAHWSDLVGVNHNNNITFWELGGLASAGIEDVAEIGVNTAFNSEVQSAITDGNAQQWLQQSFSPFAAISSATLSDIVVSEDYPLLTLVSMIAPSPDWMIAVNGLNLWDTSNNNWKETFTVDLFPYDAGTEEGYSYATSNSATVPQQGISSISGVAPYPFNSEKIGTLTITLKSTSLSVGEFNDRTSVNLYPNPNTTGKLTIRNVNAIDGISIYDVLGKNVKQLNAKNSSENLETIDISDLKDGVYIVKLTHSSGATETKRLIIN